jgi:glycosyltransferase involved in cell wall biosynthesis
VRGALVDSPIVRLLLDVSAVPARPAGAGVYTVELATGLDQRDEIELHLLARRDDAARWADIAPKAAIHPEVPERRPARIVWEQAKGPELATRLGIDVWHGPHYTMPIRLRVPAAVTVHDLTFFDHPEWHERSKVAFFRPMLRVSVQQARALIAVSEHTASRLRDRLNPRAPVLVAPHGVDHERFRPVARADADDLAALHRLGIQPPYLAFAGTLEPRKDLPTLIAAFARLAPSRPDLRLVLAGRDGWGAVAVRDAAAASGVTTRILRPGWFPGEALPALYRQSEAVAYPSLEEGFGLPALEALACGAALVTTTGSAMAEVVGDAALLVSPADPAALAVALARVLDEADLAIRLRLAGPLQAAPYTWEASINRHLAAYRLAAGVPA